MVLPWRPTGSFPSFSKLASTPQSPSSCASFLHLTRDKHGTITIDPDPGTDFKAASFLHLTRDRHGTSWVERGCRTRGRFRGYLLLRFDSGQVRLSAAADPGSDFGWAPMALAEKLARFERGTINLVKPDTGRRSRSVGCH